MNQVRDAAGSREPRVAADSRQHSALAVVLPHILRTFRREPALALTVAYLMVALAGIYYDYGYYQKGFGIPILSLAQIGDYLVAGLQQPVAIALVAATLPVCWLIDLFNTSYHRRAALRRERLRALPRRRWWQALHLHWLGWNLDNLWTHQLAYVLLIFLYGWVFVGMYAKYRVGEVKHGRASEVAVRFTGAAADFPASDAGTWSYLGGVSNYVFVYDRASDRPLVLPVNAIASLRPLPRPKRNRGAAPVAAEP